MATVSQKLITAEEFARMPDPPDGSRQELVQGVVVTMPPPGGQHGVCCSKIDRRLGTFVELNKLGNVCCNDTGFITERNPDSVRGADIAFWSRERLPEAPRGHIEAVPDLAVEVVSPDDHFARVQRKVLHYMARGVRLLWVVDPEDRSVTVYRPDRLPHILNEADVLSGEDVLPGFTCRVADLLP
ncbi:MAG: Uma2 family endonuclease [Gemmataceae bacterium]|nr:Uma2 family endonuclease [Gemmataceae bacterium]